MGKSAVDAVLADVAKEQGMRIALPLGLNLSVGLVGTLKGGTFNRIGPMRDLIGRGPGKLVPGKTKARWDSTVGKSVRLDVLARGKASTAFPEFPKASARVEVSFGAAGDAIVSVGPLTIREINSPVKLFPYILDAYDKGVWKKDYIFIIALATASSALVLVSRTADSKVLLKARGDFDIKKAAKGELSGKVSIAVASKEIHNLAADRGPVAFNAYKVKKKWFTRRRWVGVFGPTSIGLPRDTPLDAKDAFDEIPIEA